MHGVCGCPCAPIASAPLPRSLRSGGRCVRSGLPPGPSARAPAPAPPRRFAPLGLALAPRPGCASPLGGRCPCGLAARPSGAPRSRGHPRPFVGRGLQPPPPSSPLLGACSPLSPGIVRLPVRCESSPQSPRPLPPNPPRTPRGVEENRLGHFFSACAQSHPNPTTPPGPLALPEGALTPRVRAFRWGMPVPLKWGPCGHTPKRKAHTLKGGVVCGSFPVNLQAASALSVGFRTVLRGAPAPRE